MDSKGTAPEARKSAGFVYVLTNPDFPDRVKVGFAEDLDAALEGFNAAVPAPYEVFCTCTVPEALDGGQVREIFADGIPGIGEVEISVAGFCKASPEAAFSALQSYARKRNLP